MIRKVLGIAAVAAAMCLSNPASATDLILSFDGTLNSNSKNTANNPFGATNSSLAGPFSMTLRYDPELFKDTGTCGSVANTSCTFTLSSIKTITQAIKIGANTQTLVLNSGTFTLNANGNDSFSFSIKSGQVFTFDGQFNSAASSNPPGFFPLQNAVNNPTFNTGTFNLTNSYFTENTNTFYIQTNSGAITSLTASPGVPEPSIWALMILGFAAVGFALRRARSAELAFRRREVLLG